VGEEEEAGLVFLGEVTGEDTRINPLTEKRLDVFEASGVNNANEASDPDAGILKFVEDSVVGQIDGGDFAVQLREVDGGIEVEKETLTLDK
jgi:hypothetical protein